MDERSDDELMEQVRNKDQSAMAILIDRHIDSLYNYAARLSGSSSVAEDLVQDTWLAAWDKARTYRAGRVKLSTWLHRILYNRFIDTARKYKHEHTVEEPQLPISDANQPERDLDSARRDERLLRCIQQLPDNQRSALMLTHVQGFTNKDVATIMGLSVRATESLLSRARRRLKDLVNE